MTLLTKLFPRFIPSSPHAATAAVGGAAHYPQNLHVATAAPATNIVLTLLQYLLLYIMEIVLVTALSAMTFYRREMSCNSVYLVEEEEGPRRRRRSASPPVVAAAKDGSAVRPSSEEEEVTSGKVDNDNHNKVDPSTTTTTTRSGWERNDDDVTDLLLDRAGHFCSGGPLLAVVLAVWARVVLSRFGSTCEEEEEEGLHNDEQEGERRIDCVAWDAVVHWARVLDKNDLDGTVVGKPRTAAATSSSSGRDQGGAATGTVHNSREEQQLLLQEGQHRLGRRLSVAKKGSTEEDYLTQHFLPTEVQVHVFTYLTPKDVTTFACVSHSALNLVDDTHDTDDGSDDEEDSVAKLLWRSLWHRDYAWIVTEWDVGCEALERSLKSGARADEEGMEELMRTLSLSSSYTSESTSSCPSNLGTTPPLNTRRPNSRSSKSPSMKNFYLAFAETYLNYVLAGQNTSSRCLVGLHGHIFDITDFVDVHPGSPETLLVQSGRDATDYFEDLGHSIGARKLARTWCVVVDLGCCFRSSSPSSSSSSAGENGGRSNNRHGDGSSPCGLHRPQPTAAFRNNTKESNKLSNLQILPPTRSKKPHRRVSPNLQQVRVQLQHEQLMAKVRFERQLFLSQQQNGYVDIVGDLHLFYDPFLGRWRSWYTNSDFVPVFL